MMVLLGVGLATAFSGVARGQQSPPEGQNGAAWGDQSDYGDQGADSGTPLIPPNVEGNPSPTAKGGYCYAGPHPVDTRVAPGAPPWDDTQGQHVQAYPPIDTRLFAFRGGCYYFTGDPRDFGYQGQTYAYYGAHPVSEAYGGGWCFMMGPHAHLWAPWSPYFTVVGSWNYWYGPYDSFFWAYWPYYSFYYRSYYPNYYGGGRFYRGGGGRVAPPIRAVPAQAWRGSALRGGAGAPGQMFRPTPAPSPARGYTPPAAGPTFSPAPRSFGPGSGGGFHGGGGRGRR
jgi:hypothetical protein